MKDLVPDDVPRSPTGRVPNWVLDEASGRPPRDLVPFRAPTTSTLTHTATPRRGMSGLRVVLTLSIVVGVLTLGRTLWLPDQRAGARVTGQTRGEGPPVGLEENPEPIGVPQAVAIPSDSFRFLFHQDDGTTPVTWSPCRPIHYVVRTANAPSNGAQLIDDAFAHLATVTGLRFENDGSTDEAPSTDRRSYQKSRYGDRWAPVLVTWATPEEVPDFGVDIVGEAGPLGVRTPSGELALVSGTVALDAEAMGAMLRDRRERQVRLVILHELGHLVGLAHINDPSQVMAPRTRLDASTYQPGDLAGLARLGSGPCQPDV